MSTTNSLTQAVRRALRSKEDRALIEQGFMYETGSLTEEGRKVAINMMVENDKELKAQIVKVAVLLADEKKSKK